MAGAIDGRDLAIYASLLMDSSNSEMIEFLMAGMWILLRCDGCGKCGLCVRECGCYGCGTCVRV